MIGEGLNTAYNSIELGNGSVYDFMQYVAGLNLRNGILRHTINRGYLLNNLSYNIDGGFVGSYGYGSEYTTDGAVKMETTDAKRLGSDGLVPASLAQDAVGDYYSTNTYPTNPTMPYKYEEFSALGEALREENLKRGVKEDTFKNRYFGNIEKFTVHGLGRGDEYQAPLEDRNIGKLYEKRSPLETEAFFGEIKAKMFKYSFDSNGFKRTLETVGVNNGNPTTLKKPWTPWGSPLDIAKTGELERERMEFLFKPYALSGDTKFGREFYGIEKHGKNVPYAQHNYGDIFSLPDLPQKSKIELNEEGILTLYNREREAQREKYNKQYNFTKPYITRGEGSFKNGKTYSYYEEPNGEGSAPSLSVPSTSEDFIPHIGMGSSVSNLIKKTNDCFKEKKIKSLINRFHTKTDEAQKDDFLISSYSEYGLSRGRNLLRKGGSDKSTGYDNPYCRVWTALYQYSKMKDRIRPFMDDGDFVSISNLQKDLGALRPNNGAERLGNWSVLQDNGFVKISPYHDVSASLAGGKEGLKKYMFSIENLAWKGFATKDRLSDEQMGPFGGRIMWFPPYNLKFNENISTTWKDNDFIGRGEKIYTYVNTDRSGTLSFSLLVDHPSILNKSVGLEEWGDKKEEKEQEILRFFAGCGELEVYKDGSEKTEDDVIPEDNNDDITPKQNPEGQYINIRFIMFFPNNFSTTDYKYSAATAIDKVSEYEMDGSSPFEEMDAAWKDQTLTEENKKNLSRYELNEGGWDTNIIDLIEGLLKTNLVEETDADGEGNVDLFGTLLPFSQFKKINDYILGSSIFGLSLNEYEVDEIITDGYASSHGYQRANEKLARNRAEQMINMAKYLAPSLDSGKFKIGKTEVIPVGKKGKGDDVNDLDAKIARSAVMTFRIKLKDNVAPPRDEAYIDANDGVQTEERIETGASSGTPSTQTDMYTTTETSSPNGQYTAQNEYLYFSMIKSTNNLVYKNIVDKVKFFDPAFHSITPEGFNARLNFLQQCTRQGPTIGSHNGGQNYDGSRMSKLARNLSFGMAPYCILRIGDFFYSKIVIDSISISYDNDGMKWDLNPEGIGVQPMMAQVDMNFHFIGGQDIEGPVEQLQNAISYNYYANSSIYSPTRQMPMPMYNDNRETIDNNNTNQ